MHPRHGPGFSLHDLGETGRSETGTLLESEIPAHSHRVHANPNFGDTPSPARNASLARPGTIDAYQTSVSTNLATMAGESLPPAGDDQPHNMQPYLTFNDCIALQGVFPPRS
jgi:microcystin-dependent protein